LAFATFLVGGYGLALAALALAVFGAIECPLSVFTKISIHGQCAFKWMVTEDKTSAYSYYSSKRHLANRYKMYISDIKLCRFDEEL